MIIQHLIKFMDSRVIVLIFLVFTALSEEELYRKVIHDTDPNARCLDGTLPGFYLHEGGDRKNFLIFFVGGGFCEGGNLEQVLESCYQRSQGDSGSSKDWPDQTISPGGYLSTDPSLSTFANWTKLIIMYCDGAFHQGAALSPFKYKDTQLYLRGSYNTRSHIKWLINNYDLVNAEKVVFTGASSGGIATYLWTNYVRTIVKNPQKVYSIPDSGIFMNVASPKTGYKNLDILTQNLYKIANVDESTPIETCNRQFPGQQYKCLSFEYSYPFVEGRMLIINSQYDEVGIEVVLDTHCLKKGVSGDTLSNCSETQISNIETYRKQYLKFINNYLKIQKNSAWTISCSTHSYACYQNMYDSQRQKIPSNTGLTVKSAVDKFVLNEARITLVDIQTWPGNEPCAF